jgi:hypothetical protein
MTNARLHERNWDTAGHQLNGRAKPNGTAAKADLPSNAVANGVNGERSDRPFGRDAAGKFLPGNQAAKGRGNAFYRRQAGLRQALVEEVGEDGLRRLARKLLEQALAGDVAAARTLLAYAVGKPTAAVNPDEVDLDEFRLVRERPSKPEILLALVDSADPGRAAEALAKPSPEGQTVEAFFREVLESRTSDTAAQVAAEREAKRRMRK